MNTDEKRRVIHGEVFAEGRWVPIERKFEIEQQRRKKIEAGYVWYRGDWMTIDEKLRLVVPSKPPEEKSNPTIVINNYDNRTFSTVDNRTVHHYEHRHVHVDQQTLEGYMRNSLPDETSPEVKSLDSEVAQYKPLPDKKGKKMIDNKGKNRKLLPPPEDG
ncbi:MAG: hypothetical protein JW863_16095 [Chitinispirillaceae bacterium]|nr:hypothetical protein [Chitinispirillaceae bacterium]